eukprot:CAMPEP_0172606380 /NCGR_PEP_ID=MMETSP1068-20121228/26583_1 /TAXON_ID=35684 /ORGANISM="Pseudopedinella elastica, Strain CCMP716" /LENGTH=164 /DNA_ID=CAMNT_0013409065 /DNA_START=702 /DNA_END=1194 /DNA_ORIENTATION=+
MTPSFGGRSTQRQLVRGCGPEQLYADRSKELDPLPKVACQAASRVMDFSGLLDRGCSGAQVLFAGCPDISGTGELSLSLVSACLSVLSLMTSTSGALQSQAARVFGAAWASQDFGAFLDSGSNVGLLSFDAAMKLLRDRRLSMLRVIGISGKTFPADVSGQLVW